MPTFTVRTRSPEDLQPCLEVLTQIYTQDAYPVQGPSLEFLSSAATIKAWVATDASDRILGHIALSSPSETDVAVQLWHEQNRAGDIAVLERLFVAPKARREGVAEVLMRAVVEEAKARGMRVVLFALVKDAAAMRLYGRVGWEVFGKKMYRFGAGETMEAVCHVSPAN